ncbi:MAG TPA: Mut7-C RNAse domain-containing protein, partial [Telluria sp.]
TGFDTLYDNNFRDDEIERIAFEQGRIVLTRDRDLLKRRTITHGCYVHQLKAAHQLRELSDRLDLAGSLQPFTLCLNCNLPLRTVSKEAVFERLPPQVRELHDEFNACDQCRRVFWKGSHWKRMMALLDAATGREHSC